MESRRFRRFYRPFSEKMPKIHCCAPANSRVPKSLQTSAPSFFYVECVVRMSKLEKQQAENVISSGILEG